MTTSKKSIFIDKKTFFLGRTVCGEDDGSYVVEGQKGYEEVVLSEKMKKTISGTILEKTLREKTMRTY